jgi:hypothetical protein
MMRWLVGCLTAPSLAFAGAEADPHALVAFEVGHRPFGTWLVAREPTGAPSTHPTLGPLTDTGGVPFRTSIDLRFERPAHRLFNGTHGVGFTLEVVWPERPGGVTLDQLGANGTLAFEGTLELAWGSGEAESVPVSWSRGFEARPDAADRHAEVLVSSTIVHREGQYGPYRWALEGVLRAEVNLWGP